MATIILAVNPGDGTVTAPHPRTPPPPLDSVIDTPVPTPTTRLSMIAGKATFGAPLAPREMTLDGFDLDWQEQTRPGRKSVMVPRAPKLRHLSFSLLLAYPNRLTTVQSTIDRLIAVCSSTGPITINYDANTAACTWHCTASSIQVLERHPDTDEPIRATADLEFTEYVVVV